MKITKDTKGEFFDVAAFRDGEASAEPPGEVIVNGRSGSAGASPSLMRLSIELRCHQNKE